MPLKSHTSGPPVSGDELHVFTPQPQRSFCAAVSQLAPAMLKLPRLKSVCVKLLLSLMSPLKVWRSFARRYARPVRLLASDSQCVAVTLPCVSWLRVLSGDVRMLFQSCASMPFGARPLPVRSVSPHSSDAFHSHVSVRRSSRPKACVNEVGAKVRQPSSSVRWSVKKPPSWPSLAPAVSCAVRRPQEPAEDSIFVPVSEKPSRVRSAIAPPSVLRPNAGFDPATRSIRETIDSGMRSQLTTSPNGSLMRTPSR